MPRSTGVVGALRGLLLTAVGQVPCITCPRRDTVSSGWAVHCFRCNVIRGNWYRSRVLRSDIAESLNLQLLSQGGACRRRWWSVGGSCGCTLSQSDIADALRKAAIGPTVCCMSARNMLSWTSLPACPAHLTLVMVETCTNRSVAAHVDSVLDERERSWLRAVHIKATSCNAWLGLLNFRRS